MTSAVPALAGLSSTLRPKLSPSLTGRLMSTNTQRYGAPVSRAISIRASASSASRTPSALKPQALSKAVMLFSVTSLSSTTSIRVPLKSRKDAVSGTSGSERPSARFSITMSKLKVVPRFSWLETLISPPISSTSCLEIGKPSPVPPYFRVVEVSACSNGAKILPRFSLAMPIPVSCTSIRRII